MNMAISRRYFKFLKSYNKIYMSYHPKFYKLDKHYSEENNFTCFYKYCNKQQFNFYSTVDTNSTLLQSHTLQNEIFDLCINFQNDRVFLEDLKQVIQMYNETNDPIPYEISLILLKCCGNSLTNVDLPTRQKLTNQVWNLLQKKGCQITLKHYNCLLAVYTENLESINPHEFLDKMTMKPDQSIYCSLLNLIIKTENFELASTVISKMKENLDIWNQEIFNVVVKVYAMQGNIEEANKVIKEMESHKIVPSSDTYIYLAYYYAKMGNISNVIETFEKYHPSTMNIIEVIKILNRHGHRKHIESILKFLPKELKLTELYLINNTITELIHDGDRINTINIMTNLPSNPEFIDIYIEYVKHYVNKDIQSNKSDEDILQMIHETINYKNSPLIINEATKVAMYNGRESLVLTLFEHMKKNDIPIRAHYYWPLLLQAHKRTDKNKLYSLFSHMTSLGVEINKDTLIEYVLPFIDLTDPIETTKTLIQKEINFVIVVRSVSVFLLHNNRLKDLLLLLSKLKMNLDFCDSHLEKSLVQGYNKSTNKLDYVSLILKIPFIKEPPYLYILSALLNDAIESKTMKKLIHFLQILQKHKVELSKLEINVMKKRIDDILIETRELKNIYNLLENLRNNKINLNLESNAYIKKKFSSILSPNPHPNKMDKDELHNHLIELKSKNMNIRGATKRLLDHYCKENNLNAAEKLKEEMISNNFHLTPGIRAGLFYLYAKNNLLDKAEAELNEIEKFSEFKLDTDKILKYAISLVENNRIEDAFTVINKIRNFNKSSNTLNNCLYLLTVIIKNEHSNDAEKMLIALYKNNYCNLENILFSPLIERHLVKNDIESAIDTFIDCVNKYKKAPLKQKLLDIVVNNLTNSSLPHIKNRLKEVLQCISDIHGEPVTIVKLIIALAKNGNVPEIQKIFQMKNVEMTLLIFNLRNYNYDDLLDRSLIIFEAIKYEKNIRINNLCDFILSIYDKRNDSKGGIAFLKEMEAASITTSNNKLKNKFHNKFHNNLA